VSEERENLTWQGFGEASRDLARMVAADGFEPDSGKTIELVYEFIKDQVDAVRPVVIYEKPRSVIKCDYVWRRTGRWINFPWSSDPPVVFRPGQVLDA
jgi:hypothetical protein